MKKIVYFLSFIILFLPSVLVAGGSAEDITYIATFESGYDYGQLKECKYSSGTMYFKGYKVINAVTMCVWKEEPTIIKLTCNDSSYETFYHNNIKGSDGKTYYGYGCRKIKDTTKIEYIEKNVLVGDEGPLDENINNT